MPEGPGGCLWTKTGGGWVGKLGPVGKLGRLGELGTPEALGNDLEVRRVYLGENFNLEPETGRWRIVGGN